MDEEKASDLEAGAGPVPATPETREAAATAI
jgi:hypothetical protein